jgi:hypothetical protein
MPEIHPGKRRPSRGQIAAVETSRHGLPASYRVVPGKPRIAVTRAGKTRCLVGYGLGAEWSKTAVSRDPHGYLRAVVVIEGKKRNCQIHRLVLEAFVGPCPPGHLCRHLNGVPDDNRLKNLAWGTPQENSDDAVRHRKLKAARKHPLHRNARETLAALKQLLEVAEQNFYRWQGGGTRNQQNVIAAVIEARRAIASAEGRDPEKAARNGK